MAHVLTSTWDQTIAQFTVHDHPLMSPLPYHRSWRRCYRRADWHRIRAVSKVWRPLEAVPWRLAGLARWTLVGIESCHRKRLDGATVG